MPRIHERLAILETKVKIILAIVSAQLGIEVFHSAWPPILAVFAKVL